MKTIAVLTRLLPTINAVRGSGAFNVVIASHAPGLAEDLRRAANEDRIVATPLLGALDDLGHAKEFEHQQAAMALVAQLADGLLDDIAAGKAQRATVIASNVEDITRRIAGTATSLRDVFTADAGTLRDIRADAAELSSLVDAEVLEGTRDPEHALIAAQIYDLADRLPDDAYAVRQRGVETIASYAKRIAA